MTLSKGSGLLYSCTSVSGQEPPAPSPQRRDINPRLFLLQWPQGSFSEEPYRRAVCLKPEKQSGGVGHRASWWGLRASGHSVWKLSSTTHPEGVFPHIHSLSPSAFLSTKYYLCFIFLFLCLFVVSLLLEDARASKTGTQSVLPTILSLALSAVLGISVC